MCSVTFWPLSPQSAFPYSGHTKWGKKTAWNVKIDWHPLIQLFLSTRSRNNWSMKTKTSFIISFTSSLLAVLFELTQQILLMMPEYFSSNCKRTTEFTPSSFQMFRTIISPHRWNGNGKVKQEVGMYYMLCVK